LSGSDETLAYLVQKEKDREDLLQKLTVVTHEIRSLESRLETMRNVRADIILRCRGENIPWHEVASYADINTKTAFELARKREGKNPTPAEQVTLLSILYPR